MIYMHNTIYACMAVRMHVYTTVRMHAHTHTQNTHAHIHAHMHTQETLVQTELFVLLEGQMPRKGEWRCASTTAGARSAARAGTATTLLWSADS